MLTHLKVSLNLPIYRVRKKQEKPLSIENKIVKYNQQMPIAFLTNEKETKKYDLKEETCFTKDNDWKNNAANAIGEIFNNMDDFLVMFKQSQEIV